MRGRELPTLLRRLGGRYVLYIRRVPKCCKAKPVVFPSRGHAMVVGGFRKVIL